MTKGRPVDLVAHAKNLMKAKNIKPTLAAKLINRHEIAVMALLNGKRKDPELLLKLINAISII